MCESYSGRQNLPLGKYVVRCHSTSFRERIAEGKCQNHFYYRRFTFSDIFCLLEKVNFLVVMCEEDQSLNHVIFQFYE